MWRGGGLSSCVFCLSGGARHNCCDDCLIAMPRVLRGCGKCGEILEYSIGKNRKQIAINNYTETEDGYLCPSCYVKPGTLDQVWTPYIYFTPLAKALHLLKFNRVLYYSNILGHLWQRAYNDPAPKNKPCGLSPADAAKYIILPMPLHRQRQSKRGFNQSTELIKPLAKHLNLPIGSRETGLCARTKPTDPQIELSPKERFKNVKSAFRINDHARTEIKGANILIVDDVITSGATINELARELKKAGAKKIIGWALLKA